MVTGPDVPPPPPVALGAVVTVVELLLPLSHPPTSASANAAAHRQNMPIFFVFMDLRRMKVRTGFNSLWFDSNVRAPARGMQRARIFRVSWLQQRTSIHQFWPGGARATSSIPD